MPSLTTRRGQSKYELRRTERTADGVRRVARERLEDALEQLRDEGADPVEAIHEARKDMKKLRSALRLVRPALDEREYERENARYRDAARLLSDVRDAQVRGETVDGLARRYAADPPPAGWDAVRAALTGDAELEPHHVDRLREAAAVCIEEGREGAASLALNADGSAVLEAGLRRAYGRGRDRYRAALADATDARLHDWRKRAKDLWYHVRLLREAWPPVMGPLADQLHTLSDLLGDDGDMAVLRSELADTPLSPGQREHLERLIADRRGVLQNEAFALAERIYAERPKAFARRIYAYWSSGRV